MGIHASQKTNPFLASRQARNFNWPMISLCMNDDGCHYDDSIVHGLGWLSWWSPLTQHTWMMMIIMAMMVKIVSCTGIWRWHIPTPYHHDLFPTGGNTAGGNLLGNHHDHYLHHQVGQRKGHPTHHDQWSSCWTKMSSYTWFLLTWYGIFHSSIPLHRNMSQFLAISRQIQCQVLSRDKWLWETCLASTAAKLHNFDQRGWFLSWHP